VTFETKEDAIAVLETSRGEYLAGARLTARILASQHEYITIDMVRDHCPPPQSIDGRIMGAVFSSSEWECVGYEPSKRKTCHKRPIGQFKLKG